MERIKFYDDTIQTIKKAFRPDDRPVAYIRTKDKKLTISLIAVEKPYLEIKMLLKK
jgi:hypothetical protein